MGNRVLVITNSADLHADLVEERLRARGANPFRLDLDHFPCDFSLHACYAADGMPAVLTHMTSGSLELADVGAVWCRKPAPFAFRSNDLSPQERAFAQAETEHLLFSLLYSLDCFWMSHPLAARRSLWKGEQLQRAARMGFRIPRSVISNCPDAVRQFGRAVGGDIIFKAMSSASLCAEDVPPGDRESEGVPTTRISAQHLDDLDAVRELPALFQEYIDKQYELRVTVIGDRAFAARIHSQCDPRTETDYRDFQAEIPYEAAVIPDELAARCIAFVRSYGLEYGALDLIVTPEDEIVFLENNPAGQFLFVEQLVPELKMLDAVAELLATQAAKHGH